MKYAGIIYNDFSAAPGVCLTFFTQGCPHGCKGCHNPETWDFDGGKEFTDETLDSIIRGLGANGIDRDLCIMGGEPLCPENSLLVRAICSHVRKFEQGKKIKIYIWTGYTYEELLAMNDPNINCIFAMSNVLIDGRYIQEERDITLPMRGSRNQRIIDLKTGKQINDVGKQSTIKPI